MREFVVGPRWLRVRVRTEEEVWGGKLAPFFESAGASAGGEGAGPRLEIGTGEAPEEATEVRSRLAGDVFVMEGPAGEGRYDLATGSGRLNLTPRCGAFFETFLRQVFLWETYRRGGLVLHSVAFAEGDAVVLAAGPSDSGKSTLARLVRNRFVAYSDEMNVVDGEGRVWGLPFRGTGVERVHSGGGKLAVVAFHRPGEKFAAAPLRPAEAARRLGPNVFVPEAAAAELQRRAFERLGTTVLNAAALTVEVPLDAGATTEGFVKIIRQFLSAKDGCDET
ncbi:MAG: hypothetical protein JSU81_08835 [Candidatus Coatesbacteria bacterium]|nr:MAG: hypothetical protein JSU81_08835 [Candidatus Coatesbacteria bacterium]